jgi:hypothetical protein
VDYGNSRIVGSGPNGFRCIAGCSDESNEASYELNEPWSLSFDSHGNIFVTDWDEVQIKKFVLLTNACSKCYFLLLYEYNIKRK